MQCSEEMHGVICKNPANLFTPIHVLNPNFTALSGLWGGKSEHREPNTCNINVVAMRKLD